MGPRPVNPINYQKRVNRTQSQVVVDIDRVNRIRPIGYQQVAFLQLLKQCCAKSKPRSQRMAFAFG
jgi:hypothetical protein